MELIPFKRRFIDKFRIKDDIGRAVGTTEVDAYFNSGHTVNPAGKSFELLLDEKGIKPGIIAVGRLPEAPHDDMLDHELN